MSATSDQKDNQGYVEKPVPKQCSNCNSRSSEVLLPKWMVERNASRFKLNPYTVEECGVEKNQRCTIGKFAVKKTATCNLWMPKKEAQ